MSGLTNAQFDRILLQFTKLQKDNSRRIKAHQQTVKWNKSKLLRPSSDLGTFMHLTEYKIRSGEGPKPTSKLLQSYLARYLAILTGHRPVVFINLQKAKLLQAEVDDQNRAMVWVDHHKTDRTFGNAFMALLPWEVDWLKGLMEVSAHFGGELLCPMLYLLCVLCLRAGPVQFYFLPLQNPPQTFSRSRIHPRLPPAPVSTPALPCFQSIKGPPRQRTERHFCAPWWLV
ncbi:hypothetical protein MHYP_G00226070 [Metynnis hypsauchen]